MLIQAKTFAEVRQEIFGFAEKNPYVFYAVMNIGSWDFEFGVDVEDEEQIASVIQELYSELADVLLQLQVYQLVLPNSILTPTLTDNVSYRSFDWQID